MDSLIETHSREEVERALRLEAEAPIIGINCRDLQTFTVDTGLAARLGHLVPRNGILVAESGITDRVQAAQARARGADAILVGEALMRSPAVAQTTRTLATAPGGAFAGLFGRSERPLVKLCGITELRTRGTWPPSWEPTLSASSSHPVTARSAPSRRGW